MSFDTQTREKKKTLFRQALRIYEASLGVWVQRIPASQLVRLLTGNDANDPVVRALADLDRTFGDCKTKDVDMGGCLESLLLEYRENRRGDGMVCVAWAQDYPAAPTIVGMMTLHNFVASENFHTTSRQIGARDYDVLSPMFGSTYLYVDCLCSIRRGVGRLLLHHAMRYAIQRKTGVVALAFSARANTRPESAAAFEACGYEAIIPRANYRVRMYGTWFRKRVSDLSLDGIDTHAVNVCTRTGYTDRTRDTLMWRCSP